MRIGRSGAALGGVLAGVGRTRLDRGHRSRGGELSTLRRFLSDHAITIGDSAAGRSGRAAGIGALPGIGLATLMSPSHTLPVTGIAALLWLAIRGRGKWAEGEEAEGAAVRLFLPPLPPSASGGRLQSALGRIRVHGPVGLILFPRGQSTRSGSMTEF